MKLSTRGRYGLRAIVELAGRRHSGPASLSAIAAEQDISEAYLEQLMRSLKSAGIVNTVRGKSGGYALTRDPKDITVFEILSALEGSTSIAGCVGKDAEVCENACFCGARPLFLTLQNRIDTVLKETTLQDLSEDYRGIKERNENGKSLS